MKTIQKAIVALMLVTAHCAFAVTGVQLSIQGTNVVLRWPSQLGQTFIVGYRTAFGPATPWTFLTNTLPPAAGSQTTFTHSQMCRSMGFYFVAEYAEDSDGDGLDNACDLLLGLNLLKRDSNGNGINDGEEDYDGDGLTNFEECSLKIGDPVIADNVTPAPLADGLVLSGEQIIHFPADTNNHEGVLCFPDGNLGDGMAVDEPASGTLRLRWHSVFIQFGGFTAGPADDPPPLPPFPFTDEDRRLLREAFPGGGTSTPDGHVQTVNMNAVNQMRRELLEHLEQVAARRIKIAFQNIQKWNLDASIPLEELQRRTQREIDLIHTLFARGGAANTSLFRRFGRALNRILPFFGGILILANAANFAEQFTVALQDYARDIRNGDDETGDAAIVSAYCNDLAPGSGNIVLNYLLR